MSNLPPTLFIALGLFAVLILRRFIPLTASMLGMALTLAIGLWGTHGFQQGTPPAIAGTPLSKTAFYTFLVVLFAFEGLNLSVALKRRKKRRDEPATDEVV